MSDQKAGHAPSPGLETLHAVISAKSIVRDPDGRILSPDGTRQNWLVDLRKTLLDPVGLEIVAEQFWDRFADKLPFQVGGLEIGAVPLIAAIQLQGLKRGFKVNGFVVRKERKSHGLARVCEGEITEDPIVIVDDTMNSASSVEKVRVVLAETGRSIRDLFTVIDYRSPSGNRWIDRHNVRLVSLFALSQFGLHQTKARPLPPQSEFSAAWHFAASGGHYSDIAPGSTPVLDHDRLYFGSDGGEFWALDQRTGEPAWHFRVPGSGAKKIRSSPALHGARVYFGGYEGSVYCLDAGTGKEQWRFAEADWIESSPSLAPELGMLFIGLGHAVPGRRGSIAALHLSTGQKIWEFAVEGPVRASPVYDRRTGLVACGTDDGELLVFDPSTRKLLWRVAAGSPIKAAVAFDAIRHAVLVGSVAGSIHSMSLANGTARWSVKTDDAIYSTPLLVGEQVYVTSTDKHLYVLNAESGEIVRKVPTRGKNYASPRLIQGRVYFGSTSGIVHEIDPADCTMTGQLQLPERVTDSIVHGASTGLFYARSCDGQVYAFRRTGPAKAD